MDEMFPFAGRKVGQQPAPGDAANVVVSTPKNPSNATMSAMFNSTVTVDLM
jgi:hypothetical protein